MRMYNTTKTYFAVVLLVVQSNVCPMAHAALHAENEIEVIATPPKYDAERKLYYFGRSLDEIPKESLKRGRPLRQDSQKVVYRCDESGPASVYGYNGPSYLRSAASSLMAAGSYVRHLGNQQSDSSESAEILLGNQDRRQQVKNTKDKEWFLHGQITAVYEGGGGGGGILGSGTLVQGKYVLTAGHVIYDRKTGAQPKALVFTPGRNGAIVKPYASAELLMPHALYVNGKNMKQIQDNDIGVIKLKKELVKDDESMEFGTLDDTALNVATINVTGYPGQKNQGRHMYTMSGLVNGLEKKRIFYNLDTTGGQSGGAIWRETDSPTVERLCVGVHTYGADANDSSSLGKINNSGTRLTSEKIEFISGCINQ